MPTLSRSVLIGMLCLWMIWGGCSRPESVSICDCCMQAYIVGYDPCTAKTKKGFVLVFPKTGDTLVSYNLPDTLYQFPQSLFAQYQFYYLFPSTEQKKYPLWVSYHLVSEDKRTLINCSADINLADFSRAIQRREIMIDCARRQ